MIENNIREFLAAARAYLLGLMPATPAADMQLAPLPIRRR